MSGNGSAGLQGMILMRFLKDCSIYSLYQLCLPVYRKREEKLANKYSNMFSYIHLINTRPLLELKEAHFINHCKELLLSNADHLNHTQDFIKLLEIIQERIKQAAVFLTFLKDIDIASSKLEKGIYGELSSLREKVVVVLQGILKKQHSKMNGDVKERIKYVIQAKSTLISQIQTQQQQFKPNKQSKQAQAGMKEKGVSTGSYRVSSMKFFVKEKPAAVKLLSKQQVQNLRRGIVDRKKSCTGTVQGCLKQKESDKATEYKQKLQNYNTYHTQISENSDESSSQESNMHPIILHQGKNKSKMALLKHHKSNFEDYRNLKKMFESKEFFNKSNSIHKIEGINTVKHSKFVEEPPSRNSIQFSSINRLFTLDNQAQVFKKTRKNKISIMSKLQRTIKKIQVKNQKKPRGGMYISDDKLKQIDEICRNVKQEEEEDDKLSKSKSSISLSDSHSSSEQMGTIKQEKRQSGLIDDGPPQKEQQRHTRRFGTKIVRSNRQIDPSSPMPNFEKNKYSDSVTRTSIFRSSGTNFDDKKSVNKSKYANRGDSHYKTKLSKVQDTFQEKRNSKQFEELAKQYVFSKKQINKINEEEEFTYPHHSAIVSAHQVNMVLTEIHKRDKMDRSRGYEDYYDEANRRKYEGQPRTLEKERLQKEPFKLNTENKWQQLPSLKKRVKDKQERLWEYMMKAVKENQRIGLQQIGMQFDD